MTRGPFRARRLYAAAAAFCAAVAGFPAGSRAQSDPFPLRVLDVPYLPQSEALCGGAAAAMVMRYWGAHGVRAETFASLVERGAGGIPTGALASALEQRGWTVVAGAMDGAQVGEQLALGRPVIALIEDRPLRYHYVVLVSWQKTEDGRRKADDEAVIVHDPARAPFRVLDGARFERVWAKADHWALVALPPANLESARAPGASEDVAPSAACAGTVAAGVKLARENDRDGARATLARAASECPGDSAPWRELAGIDVLDERWPAAAAHASDAIARNGRDAYAWRILATARYMQHDDAGALAAWNRVGEPRVDLVDVRGLERTRYRIVARALGIEPDAVLTPSRLRLAERRLREVPAVAGGRVGFHPIEGGGAQVDAAVIERSAAPDHVVSWIAAGLHAATDREVTASFASPSGGGELIEASWRWWEHRPRTAVSFSAPAPARLGGVWRVEASRETQTFGTAPARIAETRSGAALTISDWADAGVRWRLSMDDWSGRGRAFAVSGGVVWRPFGDLVSIDANAARWIGVTPAFSTGSLIGSWRSSAEPRGTVWLARAGAQAASDDAPSSLWPGADTGHARDILLRAHPLLRDGVITGGVFGRRVLFTGAEWRRWTSLAGKPLRVAPAVFVDAARATRGLPDSLTRAQIDAGAGLRVSVPGSGVLRLDVAHGLVDGRTVLSVTWER